MQLKLNKTYGKDWIIEDNQIKLIGKCKKEYENGDLSPLKISGHRLYDFLGLNKFFPSAIAQMEMFRIISKINPQDSQINMATGVEAEKVIVEELNKIYDDTVGTTYPFTKENQGNVFNTTISDKFSSLPDYATEAKHAVFTDRKKKMKKIHEIKSAQKNKWAKDDYQNYVLEVVDDSITEDNIVDNPNKDAIKEIFSKLSQQEKNSLTDKQLKEIKDYIEDKESTVKSKAFYVSLIKRYGIQKWMVEGDLEHNLKPILKNTQSIKVKPKIAEKNYYLKRWQKDGKWWAPEDYVYQVCSYGFQYNMDKKKVIHPENVKGIYQTEINALFLDDDQMIIPKDSWFHKFNYIYNPPKPIKITKDNFIRIPIEVDLSRFYKSVINPCIKTWEKNIDNQHTEELTTIAWSILKKMFKDNGIILDQFKETSKSKQSKELKLILKTVKDHFYKQQLEEQDKKEIQDLLDLFQKGVQKSKKQASKSSPARK